MNRQTYYKFQNFTLAIVLIIIQNAYSQSQTECYNSGEKLKYLMHYGWIDGGEAYLTIDSTTFEGKQLFYTNITAQTVGIADVLYKVLDVYESYFDTQTGLPVKAVRNIKEGNYRYYNELVFSHNEDSVMSSRSGKHKIPDSCFDILSALYHLRTVITDDLSDGDTIHINTYFGDEVFPMVIRYRGKDDISTIFGKINCYKFVPVVEVGRAFEHEDDMIIWMSTKNNHIPVRVKFNLFVGSIKFDLIEYANLKSGL